MADRFPSLDDFDAGETEARPNGNAAAVEDAGDDTDFLARERAALGDDADLFTTSNDQAATVEDGEDDLLGGREFQSSTQPAGAMDDFESSFPAIDTSNEGVAPGGTITGSAPFSSSYSGYQQPEDEAEPVRQWREKRNADLARRAEISEEKKAGTVKKAQEDIDSFYESYNAKVDKAKATTRKDEEEFLAARQDTAAGGTSWERIAKLVDVSGKGVKGGASGSGKERFREMLIDLKKDEKAPGASGV